ncbi:hypothetical protein [Halobaculum magnesiiphilum]|uniref:Uncharacterized protein n=1 Tax=Halobaculum magnesiiphilum TaxID=1017351 RepID=A0A8T8WD06_9EURY|nr:hypothetical protein [Halobaculum magnesiiphilum]QZP37752.1 hypothetical protein K6T50_00800 [Halobaculum magnesiiphilum]
MSVADTLDAMKREPRPLSPLDDFETAVNQTGTDSEILSLQAETVLALRDGADLMVSIPAYESFTTDGTADNTETFSLSHDLVDSPNTQSVVLYEGGSRASPDSIDYDNDTIDYTDDGTDNTLHVYYIVGDAATLTVEKVSPGGKTSQAEELKTLNAGRANRQDQQEDPIEFHFRGSWLERFLATDMVLSVKIDAPYTVQFREDTDGTEATNALFHTTATKGASSAPGLLSAINDDMGGR